MKDRYVFDLDKKSREALNFLTGIGISVPEFIRQELKWLHNHFLLTMIDGEIDQDLLQTRLRWYKEEIKRDDLII